MNDSKIIEALRSNNQKKIIVGLYRYMPKIQGLIVAKGGTKQDAQDIFQEALIILCEKVQEVDFNIKSSLNTYLFGICRFLWMNELKKRKRHQEIDFDMELTPQQVSEMESTIEDSSRIIMLETILSELGQRCLELLTLFYYKSLKMAEIAKKMKFKSDKIAKNQKYKCIERAKLKLQEHCNNQ